jgi:hypothetical protein
MIIWIIIVGLKFKPMLVGFKLNKGTNGPGCDHNQMNQCPYQTTKKLLILQTYLCDATLMSCWFRKFVLNNLYEC